jgi:UDP-N-acetylmuramate--alanine ligase
MQYSKVYFLGIGGIGMSAIARWFVANNFEVAGYDKTPTPLTQALEAEGASIHFTDSIDAIPASFLENTTDTLVVYTPAIPKDHLEFNYLKDHGFTLMKRSQVLGLLTENMFTIGVAGTHGKTTTSSMVTHVLKAAGQNVTAFLGGITQNYGTNFLLNNGPENIICVVEADEFDRSFLTLAPNLAIVTSTDADHLDIYGDHSHVLESFQLYVNKLKPGGKAFIQADQSLNTLPDASQNSYGLNQGEIQASNIRIENAMFIFDIVHPKGTILNIEMQVPGFHNVENAVATAAVCLEVGLSEAQIKAGLASFGGVKRRFEYYLKTDKAVFIDDYAHHPTEISAALKSVRALYPSHKLTVAFQPHLFSRTNDFQQEFAESLDLADKVFLLDIYPARELPMPGVTSAIISKYMKKATVVHCQKHELVALVKADKPSLFVTLGAGDIDTLLQDIKQTLQN